MKICLVCSYGGHLAEMLQLLDAFEGHDVLLVTYETISSKEIKDIYSIRTCLIKLYETIKPSLFKVLIHMTKAVFEGAKILLQEKPDIIVSTGSEIAVPFCYIAKILHKKVIFIDTLSRVHGLSGAGKIVYPIADLFLVQWKFLTEKYKKAKYAGNVL